MIDTILLTALVLCLFGLLYCFYMLDRINRVGKFLTKINEIRFDWGQRHLMEIVEGKEVSAYEWLEVPEFDTLLYSMRPLEFKEWFDSEDLRRLFS